MECPISQTRRPGLREAPAQNWGGPDWDSCGLSRGSSGAGQCVPQFLYPRCAFRCCLLFSNSGWPKGTTPWVRVPQPLTFGMGSLEVWLGGSSGPCLRGNPSSPEGMEQGQAPEVWICHSRASWDVRGFMTQVLTWEGPSPTPAQHQRVADPLGTSRSVQANLPEALAVREPGPCPTQKEKSPTDSIAGLNF